MCASSADASSCAQLTGMRGPAEPVGPGSAMQVFGTTAHPPPSFVEYQRLQLFDYSQASRLRIVQPGLLGAYAGAFGPYAPPPGTERPVRLPAFLPVRPEVSVRPGEPKPQHSYIGLIAMAILSSAEKKMVLSDIYQYILDNYPYFRNRGPGLAKLDPPQLSLNDCFVKGRRAPTARATTWAIHPANVDDFKKGDFRRRKLSVKCADTWVSRCPTTTTARRRRRPLPNLPRSNLRSKRSTRRPATIWGEDGTARA
ncbi:hypothetical protein HPB52_016449 [Rhipicephalus sanguineus]|uniref:Fork-head domain-containing protein n=1 Tax=Rhipicephalus sanguineus TaxID=34632 RepID=A0A9D4T0R3_RHISA|nr:hypothetical protein HPB52_016449 [Rhipicephalus sanguineus]